MKKSINYFQVPLKDINLLPKISGIYSITNVLNNHRYIGSTHNFYERLTQHRGHLRKNKHHSIALQRAYNKYGEKAFVAQILEICENSADTLFFIEQKYLDLHPEYNISNFANRPCNTGYKMSEETKQRLRQFFTGRKRSKEIIEKMRSSMLKKGGRHVFMYNLNGEFLKEFPSVKKANQYLSMNENSCAINACCSGRYKSAFGYMWSYEKKDKLKQYKKDNAKRRKLAQYDLQNNLIAIHESIVSAAKKIGNANRKVGIQNCLAGKQKIAYNYKWKYYDN